MNIPRRPMYQEIKVLLYWLQNTLRLPSQSVAYIPLVLYVSGFFATLVMKPLNRCLGRKVSEDLFLAFALRLYR